MAGDVRISITGSDETKAAFASVEAGAKKIERALSGLSKFSLGSAGIGVGFAALAIHLEHVAERLKDTNPEAAEFVRTMDRLKAVAESGLVGVFAALNPILKELASDAEAMAGWIAQSVADLKTYEEARDKQRRNDPLDYRNSQAFKDYQANQAAKKNLSEGFNPTSGHVLARRPDFDPDMEMGVVMQFIKERGDAVGKAIDDMFGREKRASKEALEQWNQSVEQATRLSKNLADQMKEDNAELDARFKTAGDQVEDMFAREHLASKQQEEAEKKLFDQREKAAQEFGDLFANILVESNRTGLKQVLADFVRALAIMAAKTQAMKLFSAAESSGGWFGSALTAVFGGGKASGGPVGARQSYLVGEQGPELFTPMSAGNITPNSAMGNVVNINQNVSVGAGASRAEVAAAMTVAKAQAVAEIRNAMKRGQ
jgi:hypothetical protein